MIARRPVTRSVVQSINQSINPSLIARSLTHQSINQLTNRTFTNQPINQPVNRSLGRRVLPAVLLVTVGSYSVMHFHTSTKQSTSQSTNPSTDPSTNQPTAPLSELPISEFQKKYSSSLALKSGSSVILYQYQTCPFCNKLRAFLDSEQIPYSIVEVDPMSKKQIKFAAPYKAVPVLTIDGYTLADSSHIIQQLQKTMDALDHKPINQSIDPEELKWRSWVDTNLIYLTAPNLYTSLSASLDAMDYIMKASDVPTGQRYLSKYIGGPMMYLVSEYKLKKKRNITDPRGQLYAACREFASSRKNNQSIQLSDITAFGVCRAFSGFPAGEDIMKPENTSQQFVEWFHKMKKHVGKSSAKNSSGMTVGADYVGAQ